MFTHLKNYWMLLIVFLHISLSTVYSHAALPPALKAYEGQVLYLDFWASWCTPCAHSFPWLNQLHSRYQGKLTVVAVNVDETRTDAVAFLRTHPAQFAVEYDAINNAHSLAKFYKVAGMPAAVLLDAQGNILHSHHGFKVGKVAEYEAAITAALR